MIYHNRRNIIHLFAENHNIHRLYYGSRLVFERGLVFSIYGSKSMFQGERSVYTAKYILNDASSYTWNVTNAERYSVSGNRLTVTSRTDNADPIIIECTLTKKDGTTLYKRKEVEVKWSIAYVNLDDVEFDGTDSSADSYIRILPEEYAENYTVNSVYIVPNDYVRIYGHDDEKIQLFQTKVNDSSSIIHIEFGSSITTETGDQYDPEATAYLTNPITNFKIKNVSDIKEYNLGSGTKLMNRISIGIITDVDNVTLNVYNASGSNIHGFGGIYENGTSRPYGYIGSDNVQIDSSNNIHWFQYTDTQPVSYIPPEAVRLSDTISAYFVVSINGNTHNTTVVDIPENFNNFEGKYAVYIFRVLQNGSVIFDQNLSNIESNGH